MRDRNVFFVLDQILEASRRATSFVEGRTGFSRRCPNAAGGRHEPCHHWRGGDAARTRSGEFVAAHPNLPLNDMVGLRNRIAHGYTELNFRVNWQTVLSGAPELLCRLDTIYEAAGEQLGGAPNGPTED
nr:HepT-like ribonuclease domain-containing protein [Methylocystis sp. MJC1]